MQKTARTYQHNGAKYGGAPRVLYRYNPVKQPRNHYRAQSGSYPRNKYTMVTKFYTNPDQGFVWRIDRVLQHRFYTTRLLLASKLGGRILRRR
jgi:hypothetical protein